MKLVLGVTGSISAYKAVDVQRLFQKNGHEVAVVLTANAKKLITPVTFETFSPGRVFVDMWEAKPDYLAHIRLSQEYDLLLIAPATANIIGKMAAGVADDLLSTLYLAFTKKVIVAPAMNSDMFAHPAVQENIQLLLARGVEFIEPEEGMLACGRPGKGRLPSVDIIYRFCCERIHV